jgi:tetratricopeptide (TPR) repeat protein
MKNPKLILIAFIAIAAISCQPAEEKIQEEPSPWHDGINWAGENEIANYLAMQGINHWMNIEREKAYTFFEKSVELDSSQFACHTALALMSRGDKREYHKEMAKKYVVGENEVSNLFVSLLDIPRDSTGAEARRETWAKMHELSNGPFIHIRYATSRADRAETLEELDNLESILAELDMTTAHIYNIRGYLLNLEGDLEKGTASVDKYLEMRPHGYNGLDSRAEFYLFAGDTTSAIEYYKKTVEQFPFALSARNSLRYLDKD